MSTDLIIATASVTVAALVYSIAVFAEFRARGLKVWHLVLFWTGLVFDTFGTTMMARISGGFHLNIHGVLGIAAIVIMLVHAGWASIVLARNDQRLRDHFHHFSLTAWTLWIVSFVTGLVIAIPSMR